MIDAPARRLTAWRDEAAADAGDLARQFIASLDTLTKRQIIDVYSAGIISEAEAVRLIQENGLRYA